MDLVRIPFSQSSTNFVFDARRKDLHQLISGCQIVVLADERALNSYPDYFGDAQIITIPSGEDSKSLEVLGRIVERLMELEIDRNALLIGFGGGVTCDIAGFVAGIYKRGIRCALVPTTVLAMVDAAIGGKNGINLGVYKNMLGLICQPEFIFFDYSSLQTLPDTEWQNGIAEMIKHACIADEVMFEMLMKHDLQSIQEDEAFLAVLIKRNALLKAGFIEKDEFEKGMRKQLNFGHTMGHAIEREMGLKHGFAVAIGMMFAAGISETMLGFSDVASIKNVLEKYNLPINCNYNSERVLNLIQSDKKRFGNTIDFILLKELGAAVIQPIGFDSIECFLNP